MNVEKAIQSKTISELISLINFNFLKAFLLGMAVVAYSSISYANIMYTTNCQNFYEVVNEFVRINPKGALSMLVALIYLTYSLTILKKHIYPEVIKRCSQ